MQNVVWSTAIQHGEHTNHIVHALSDPKYKGTWNQSLEKDAIKAVYAERIRVYKADTKRYKREEKAAIMQLMSIESVYNGNIRSLPKETNGKMTYCSRTAQLNAARFGIPPLPNGDAFVAKGKYGSDINASATPPSDARYADVFSGSTDYPTI